MVNLYDTPAQAQFINTYVPIQFEGLYKLADQAKEGYLEGQAIMDRLAKYRTLNSASIVDNKKYADKVASVYKTVGDNVSDVTSLSDPTVRAKLYSSVRDLESDPDLKMMIENKEAYKQTLSKVDPRWGDYYKNMISNNDSTANGLWAENPMEYSTWAEGSDALTKEIGPRKIGTTDNGFTDIIGVHPDDVKSVLAANTDKLISDKRYRAMAEVELSNLYKNNSDAVKKYATKDKDTGEYKIDGSSIDKYIMDNMTSAALDRTNKRDYRSNDYKMMMYKEHEENARLAARLEAKERKGEYNRISSLINVEAKSQIANSKIDSTYYKMNNVLGRISDPSKAREIGEKTFGRNSYEYYLAENQIKSNQLALNNINNQMSQLQASGNSGPALNNLASKANKINSDILSLSNKQRALAPGVLSETERDEDLALRNGKGRFTSYNEASSANVYNFNSSVGNGWNMDRYGSGVTKEYDTLSGGKLNGVPVSNAKGLKLTDVKTLDENLENRFVMKKLAPGGGKMQNVSISQSKIRNFTDNFNNLLQNGPLAKNSFIVDGGTARFSSNGSRKLNYIYIPESELNESGMSRENIAFVKSIPGASRENIVTTKASSTKTAITEKYIRIPVSGDFITEYPNSPENVQLDARMQEKKVYKESARDNSDLDSE